MKNSIITLAFVMFLSGVFANPKGSEPESDTSYCLEINGKILNISETDKTICRVELICLNKVIDSAFLKNSKKKFTFYLEKEKSYTIRITMRGHLPKLVSVDTRNAVVPADDDELLYFAFETTLDKDDNGLINDEYRDAPIAKLYYDLKHKQFEYNKEYTATVKKELYLTAK